MSINLSLYSQANSISMGAKKFEEKNPYFRHMPENFHPCMRDQQTNVTRAPLVETLFTQRMSRSIN